MAETLPTRSLPPSSGGHAWSITFCVTAGPHAGQVFSFDQHDTFLVGRSKHAHFCLPEKDPYFSRHHFVIEVNPPSGEKAVFIGLLNERVLIAAPSRDVLNASIARAASSKAAVSPALQGLLSKDSVPAFLVSSYNYAWFIGFAVAFGAYLVFKTTSAKLRSPQ